MQGHAAVAREQIRAGIAEGAGATGDDAALLCGSLVMASGAARGGDGEVLAEVAAATRRVAAGSAALEVAVRHVELVRTTVAAPHPELVAQYAALHRDAVAEDHLHMAWLAATNAARLLLAAGLPADALTWSRSAVRAAVELGSATTRTSWRCTAPRSAGRVSTSPHSASSGPSTRSTGARACRGRGTRASARCSPR